MKLLILSDSHGHLEAMRRAIWREKPEVIFHLGDHSYDAAELQREFPAISLQSVRGNCDFYDISAPEQLLLELEGVRILALHGHTLGVKQGLLRLSLAAREQQVDLALFGHTHQPLCQWEGSTWLVNPGACGRHRATYAVAWVEKGTLRCQISELEEET